MHDSDSDPYLGAIVHYRRAGGSRCFAAMITQADDARDGTVWLNVFPAGGNHYPGADVPHLVEDADSWHWRHECED